MYVTRRLSELQKSPNLLSSIPEGPNSGYLVIQDEESEKYSFFGLHKNKTLKELPFPQNMELTVKKTTTVNKTTEDMGENSYTSYDPVFMIPVLNQPLSSNRYYAIDPHGKHIGKAITCSREEDMDMCCFCLTIQDVKPKPLDPNNIYQQFKIVPYEVLLSSGGYFSAKSIAPNGFPPYFLRQKGWNIQTKTPSDGPIKLDEARGVDLALRARLPKLNITPSMKSSQPVVVGKWYCPFMFVKEGTLRDQVKRSMYYEMTLEQRWDQIFSFHKNVSDYKGNSVVIDAMIEKEEVLIPGYEVAWSIENAVDGVIRFTGYDHGGDQASVGLRKAIVRRMKWEQERFGWADSEEKQMKINKVEEFKESWQWTELKCYVLVETFNLKRMDGSLVMTYDFKHCDKIQTKWE